jgi:N-acetylneuraminic acid mutarotase
MVIRMLVIVALVAACDLDTKIEKNACTTQEDCLDGYVCTAGTCELPTQCTPVTCEANQCEMIDDGCGAMIDCGGCPSGQECGLVNANQCGTPPPHCTNESQDASLGETGVDCGGSCAGCATGGGCKTTADCAAGNTCTDDVCLAGTWSTAAQMPTARDRLAVVVGADGLIYAIGGSASGGRTAVVEVYNPTTNSWSARTPMPTARYGFAAVLGNDGKIYTIGGQYFSVSDDAQSVIVEVYTPATDSWQALPSLPEGRYNPAAVVAADGTIYVTGGYRGTLGASLATTIKLAPGGTSWVAVTPAMTSARSTHAMARTANGRLYAFGGSNANSNSLATIEYMVPGTPGWNTLTPMTYGRSLFAAVVKDDQIYAIGGNATNELYSATIEVFSPATNSWSRAPSLPTGRYGHAAVTLPDGKIFVIGGRRRLTQTTSESTRIVDVLTP